MRRLSPQGQHDDKAARPPLALGATDLTAVSSRDLPHQRQPEPRARSGPRAEERLENLLAIGLTHASATVADGKLHAFAHASHSHPDRRRAVALRVLEEIADQTPQQSRIAAHDDRLAIELNALVAGAFLRGEREQVHVFLS